MLIGNHSQAEKEAVSRRTKSYPCCQNVQESVHSSDRQIVAACKLPKSGHNHWTDRMVLGRNTGHSMVHSTEGLMLADLIQVDLIRVDLIQVELILADLIQADHLLEEEDMALGLPILTCHHHTD